MPTENEIAMLRAARADGVESRNELANLMAQLGHESGGFAQMEESFRYTGGIERIPVRAAFREGADTLETARLAALQACPQELARLMYGNRMGNDDAGDGYRYRGRGFIQLTGKDNYRAAGDALDLDLVNRPELAAERANAARIALWYWRERVPAADRDDVSAATRRINGGLTGLADRHGRFDAWHALLTPAFLADLDAGRIQPGAGVGALAGQRAMDDAALRRLETGEAVGRLQSDLARLGVTDARGRALVATNTFDAATEQAVRRFQEHAGLPVTGRAGPETLEAVADAIQRREQLQTAPQAPGVRHDGRDGADAGRAGRATVPAEQRLGEADRSLLATIRQCIERLDAAHGRAFDEGSERASWALLPAAKACGMTRADHAVLSVGGPRLQPGDNLFIVQGRLDDPAHLRTHVRTVEAMSRPIEDSLAQLEALNHRQSAEVSQSLARTSPDPVERIASPPHRLA